MEENHPPAVSACQDRWRWFWASWIVPAETIDVKSYSHSNDMAPIVVMKWVEKYTTIQLETWQCQRDRNDTYRWEQVNDWLSRQNRRRRRRRIEWRWRRYIKSTSNKSANTLFELLLYTRQWIPFFIWFRWPWSTIEPRKLFALCQISNLLLAASKYAFAVQIECCKSR